MMELNEEILAVWGILWMHILYLCIYSSIIVNKSMYVSGDHIFEYALKVSKLIWCLASWNIDASVYKV